MYMTISDWLKGAKVGISALAILLAAFAIGLAIGSRPDQQCFAPPTKNWAFHVGQAAYVAMLLSGFGSLYGLWLDKRKWYAITAFILFVPLMLSDAIHSGCW